MESILLFLILFAVSFNPANSDKSQLSFPLLEGRHSLVSSLIKLNQISKEYESNNSDNSPRTSSSIRVVGGTEADPNQFPFQVSVQVRNYYEGYDHNCGGVIYDNTHILTAAHCVRGIHHRNLKIVAGEHELFNDVGTEQYRDVQGYVFHPGYNPQTYDNDIAIITLDYPFDLNDMVEPITLPLAVREHSQTARTSGWGSTGKENEEQKILMYVDLNVYTHEECKEAYKGQITTGMMCAGVREGGKGSCNGDSGGGLTCKDESGREYLCGLVSWGTVPCAREGFPTVFTSINSYIDFLQALLPPQINQKTVNQK